MNADVRHREAALARPRQEVGDVGVEPDIVAAGRPQAERAVRALPRQQPVDRIADALVDRGVEREMRFAREIVDIEQRQRAAGDLLGAAERIAVERLSSAAASSAVETPTETATLPVPGTRSANRSFDSVRLSPLAIGRTVRRARICVAGFAASA